MIATGGRPRIPPVQGCELGITSDGFFELDELPRRVAVVGSGYIAVELAGVLRALGSEVTLVIRHDMLLRHFDALLAEKLMAAMTASGIEVATKMSTVALERKGESLTLEAADGRTFPGFDTVIWAIGRRPNVEDLGLESASIGLDAEDISTSTSIRTRPRRASTPSATCAANPSSRPSRSRPAGGSRTASSAA